MGRCCTARRLSKHFMLSSSIENTVIVDTSNTYFIISFTVKACGIFQLRGNKINPVFEAHKSRHF